ncbi:hypothetical protein GXM_03859 [Nostoc sphaeroides CCNUC1]|uniref:Uncharacterized protein n=1 Tax=Nostoc sphaeroides CCNUC1 TaxID=2653204 RepID=A0A5P8W0Y7_9NOSO|nr:hypothetical protein GXM_03859 [Nostoc sphaeroides CCNUC1]
MLLEVSIPRHPVLTALEYLPIRFFHCLWLNYSRLQVGEVQIIVRAWQCHAPTSVPHLPEIRCIFNTCLKSLISSSKFLTNNKFFP